MLAVDDILDDDDARRIWRSVLSRALADSLGLDLRMSGIGAGRDPVVSGARAFLICGITRDDVLSAAGLSADVLEDLLPELRRLWRLADKGHLPAELQRTRRRREISHHLRDKANGRVQGTWSGTVPAGRKQSCPLSSPVHPRASSCSLAPWP